MWCEHTLPRPHLTGENCPHTRFTAFGAQRRTFSGPSGRRLSQPTSAVRDKDQVSGRDSDNKSRVGANAAEGLGDVGLVVQKRWDRAVDKRAVTICRWRGQDVVAGAKVLHPLGDAAAEGDLGIAWEATTGFGCHGMFWRDERLDKYYYFIELRFHLVLLLCLFRRCCFLGNRATPRQHFDLQRLHLQIILGHGVIHNAGKTLTLTQGRLYLSGSAGDC